MDYILETVDLTKKYGKKCVVDEISFHIKRGEIYGLIGENGAGKTTCMKMIAGLSNASFGQIIYKPQSGDVLRIGSLIENPGFYYNMTAYENLKCVGILTGRYDSDYIKYLLEAVSLHNGGKKKVGEFSLGMRQRLGVAIAIAGDPEFLILDEPINGLDPQGIVDIRNLIIRMNKEKNVTILMSSHILGELDKIVDTIGVIDNGKLIDEFDVKDMHKKNYVEIEISDSVVALEALNNINENDIEVINSTIIRIAADKYDIREINKYIANCDCGLIQSKFVRLDLETRYIDLLKNKR